MKILGTVGISLKRVEGVVDAVFNNSQASGIERISLKRVEG